MLGVIGLAMDMLNDALAQRQRRHRHLLELARLGIAGDVVEHPRRVAPDRRLGGEVGEVGVDARRDRVVVAGSGVHIGREVAALAAHHHRELGVGLQFDEAVDDLHAGAFEVARPADVGFLVEPRLQLDQGGDGFAGFGGLRQRAHDRRIVRGAVQRLLDRDHVGIARGLLQELHDHVERFIGVVDNQVFLTDRRKDVAAMVAHALGMAWNVRRELKIRPVEAGQLRQLVHRQHAVDEEYLVIAGR